MNDMLQRVKEKYPDFDITSRHISNIVRDNNITLKLTRFRHGLTKRFGKDININKNIKLFYKKVKQYKIDYIICIDETSIKSLQKRKFCYSRMGKRCVVKTHSQEGLTYNHLQTNIANVLCDIPLITIKNIFKGVYERPEKYKPKNKTRKIKKNYL